MKLKVIMDIKTIMLKHGLLMSDLGRTHSKFPKVIKARREVAYTLAKDHNFLRREIAEVLHCKLPQVTYLIKQHCHIHKLPIPQYITKETVLTTVHKFLCSNTEVDASQLKKLLMSIHVAAYQQGRNTEKRRVRKLKKLRGLPTPRVTENNAPVSVLRAHRGILNGVKDDQSTTQRGTQVRNQARQRTVQA